ncbi:MAG: NAD(P)H-hydrate dehydratase [Opitutae bacterium]
MHALPHDPILALSQAHAWEEEYFNGDEKLQWDVMTQAGEAVADSALRDMRELRTIPHRPRLMVLVGKGHNGADALIATRRFLRTIPTARATIWQWASKEECRPLTQRAFEELIDFASKRLEILPVVKEVDGKQLPGILAEATKGGGFDLLIDGLLGMQSRPGLKSPLGEWIKLLNQADCASVRVSIDLPSGISESSIEDAEPFRADFTYCTGIVKVPVVKNCNQRWVGRLRYLDLGFFNGSEIKNFPESEKVLRSSALAQLRKLRPVDCDKRDFGHLLMVAGSRDLGGAALMCAQGALRAGVGLLTCCVPESLHASFVSACPEAMWVPMPETPKGGLALEGLGKVRQFLERADALVVGPGIGSEEEAHAFTRETCKLFPKPLLVDADGLRTEIIDSIQDLNRLVLTPHAGELDRLSGKRSLENFLSSFPGVILRKGPHPQILSGGTILHLFSGSSLLARGGSGDLLSGIIGSLMARGGRSLADCAALGALWHGRAAEVLARQHGQEAVTTTQILEYLSFALRNDF